MIAQVASVLLAASGPSDLSEVVVYPDRARITRRQSVSCERTANAQFDALPPAADVASLRAAVSGGELRGLWTEERARDKAFSAELQALRDQIRKLERQRAQASDLRQGHLDTARLAEAYLKSTGAGIGRELEAPPKSLASWQKAMLGSLQKESDALEAASGVQATLRDLDRRLGDLNEKANRLDAAGARKERVVQVLVSCAQAGRVSVALTYVVGGASWSAAYEARGEPEEGLVALTTSATVRQATGEDWRGVRLTLSTALPLANATPPEIAPLFLGAVERMPPKKVLVSSVESAGHAEVGAADVSAPAKDGLAARSQGLSVQLDVPGASTVPGNGQAVRLEVGHERLAAHFAERLAPALAPFVFRVGDLTNHASYPLLPGPVEVYWKGGFIGRQALDRVPVGGAFHITFGLDERLKVERDVLEEVQRETGVLGKSHRLRYGYRVKVTNHTRETTSVELAEQVPVSEVDDVAVAIDPQTTPGFERREQEGLLRWKLALHPAAAQVVEVHFHVDVPSDYDTGGL